MKIIAKVFIGCIAFIMILGQLVDLGQSPEDKFNDNVKASVRIDMENAASRSLNYPSTYRSDGFFLINGEASLYYYGANAFGVESYFSLHADVESFIETETYKITNLRSNK
tara:strand:- start:771 stop:1103 length:333 start_codon:yes stop_codon:yes gene_type:complete